jgi:4'-phosphopantetheinyl transferase
VCRLELCRPDGPVPAYFAFVRSKPFEQLAQWADGSLGAAETAGRRRCRTREREASYLSGRFAAHHAVAMYFGDRADRPFEVVPGVFNQPIVRGDVREPPAITISHTANLAVAIAHDAGHQLGVDVEQVRRSSCASLARVLTESESQLAAALPWHEAVRIVVLWTIKEALSKALRCGLTVPLSLLEVSSARIAHDGTIRSRFTNFAQYGCQTWLVGDHVLSIALPRETQVTLDTNLLA